MNGAAWFGLGMVASPAVALGALLLADEIEPGRSWECPCGYHTGDRKQTRRIVARSRWFWHRRIKPGHARRPR